MATVDLVMPKMGESIIEATILKWSKQVGEEIEQDETVLEIATDKVDSEVPSPVDGKLLEVRFNEGDVVAVGEVIAVIETEVAAATVAPGSANGQHKEIEEAKLAEQVPYVPSPKPVTAGGMDESRFYSPLVLNIARK